MIFYDKRHIRRPLFRVTLLMLMGCAVFVFVSAIIHIAAFPKKVALPPDDQLHLADSRKVALTFDDGPDAVYTRKIIQLLNEEKVPATFFLIGEHVLENPDVARELTQNGFEIGNHTFTHGENVHTSSLRMYGELMATRRLIEHTTGVSPLLYRPPSLVGINRQTIPGTERGLALSEETRKSGHLAVGAGIDPRDWDGASPDEIITRIRTRLPSSDGNAILFHDSGKNAANTLSALEKLIPILRSEGYEFVFLSELIGLQHDSVMPPVQESLFVERALFSTMFFAGTHMVSAGRILIATMFVLGIVRFLGIFFLWMYSFSNNIQIKNAHKQHNNTDSTSSGITVLIPAYNEEANIAATLLSVIQNTVRPQEIIVINDCSTDNTVQEIERIRVMYPHLVRVVGLMENHGKAYALNVGLRLAKNEIIVTVDGDTILDKNTLFYLRERFADPLIAAVAGEIRIADTKRLVSKFQEIEYLVGQRIEKRVFSMLGAVNIVPGALGAWRASAIYGAGGYTNDTLTEDQDLTLAVLIRGGKIVYEDRAVAYTEAPEHIRAFLCQRFRWTFGTMQCVWKYRHVFFNAAPWQVTRVILPNNIIYGMFFPLMYPFIDLYAVVSAINGTATDFLFQYAVFISLDLAYASLALWPDRRTRGLVPLVPFQRLYYRVLFYTIFKSCIRAVEGTTTAWQRLERNGHAQTHFVTLASAAK